MYIQAHSEACSWGQASQRRNECELKEACLFDVRHIIACLYTDGRGQAERAKLIIFRVRIPVWGGNPRSRGGPGLSG